MYNREFFKDHVTEFEDRYREQNNPDGTITHIPVEGEVIQEGTPQNAAHFNNMEEGIFAANELGAELARVLLERGREIDKLKGQTGKITLTNSSDYPFNNSEKSVSLASVLDTTDYTIDTEVEVPINGESVGRIVIRDKLKNGFKIGFTGSAQSVTVKYTVRGGII